MLPLELTQVYSAGISAPSMNAVLVSSKGAAPPVPPPPLEPPLPAVLPLPAAPPVVAPEAPPLPAVLAPPLPPAPPAPEVPAPALPAELEVPAVLELPAPLPPAPREPALAGEPALPAGCGSSTLHAKAVRPNPAVSKQMELSRAVFRTRAFMIFEASGALVSLAPRIRGETPNRRPRLRFQNRLKTRQPPRSTVASSLRHYSTQFPTTESVLKLRLRLAKRYDLAR